jgi:hypothetical protein
MSVLEYHGRPWAAFDPKNVQHREWFAQFQSTRTWGKCPVRFYITDDAGDLITLIQRKLIDFYVNLEFGPRTNKASAI